MTIDFQTADGSSTFTAPLSSVLYVRKIKDGKCYVVLTSKEDWPIDEPTYETIRAAIRGYEQESTHE